MAMDKEKYLLKTRMLHSKKGVISMCTCIRTYIIIVTGLLGNIKNVSVVSLTDISWNWFELIMNDIQDMANLKEKSLKDLVLGNRPKEKSIYTDTI